MPFLGLQTSFTAGELSPSLSTRVDLSRYQTGCKTLENMLVHPHGGASKRYGFRYLASLSGPTRLMPFVFSATNTYVLAFGEKKLYFFTRNGALITNSGDGEQSSASANNGDPNNAESNQEETIYSIDTPYTAEEAKSLSFVQSADVLYLASAHHPPHKLARYGHTRWTLEAMDFTPKVKPPINLSGKLHDVRTSGEVNGDGSGTRNWLYVVTKINENGEESLPSQPVAVTAPENLRNTCYPKLTWESGESAENNTATNSNSNSGENDEVNKKPAIEYRVYQEKNGKYGYIGSSLNLHFDAKNIAPDMTDTPPEDTNPFIDGNNPKTVCFFQQRLVFGGSNKKPQTIWFSRTGHYESFSKSSPAKADDAMEISIAGNEVSHIEWLVPLRTLLVGTSGTEWEVKSSGGALHPADISIVPQSYRGSAKLPAMIVGNSVLHLSRTNREMRDLLYDFGTDSYTGSDHAILASHLFEEHHIVDWAYQQSPNSIIWCVRSDGTLLGHTYLREHQVFAWHRHTTKGKFASICTIPSPLEDEVFAVTERVINGRIGYYLECMETNCYHKNLDFFSDCALAYEADKEEGKAVSRIYGLDHLLGEDVVVVADGAVCPIQQVRDFSALSALEREYALEHTFCFKNKELHQTQDTATNTTETPSITPSIRTVSSTRQIDGNRLQALSSDMPQTQVNASQIGIELPFQARNIVVGLPFSARLQSMPLEPDVNSGSGLGRKKYINRIGVYFKDTNFARIGTEFDSPDTPNTMDEVKWRLAEKPGEATRKHSEDAWIYTNGTYQNQVHACVESNQPLACTVLAILPEFSVSSV